MRRTILFLLVPAMLGLPTLSRAQAPSCAWAPDPATTRDAILFGVDTVDASSAWAVGSVRGARGRELTLVRRWDGTEWQTQPSPNVKEQSNRLNDVVALPDGTAWAIGNRSRSTMKTIVQRYDGTRWRMQRSPNPSETLNSFEAVDVTPSGTVYAVGTRWNAKRQHRTMIHSFDGAWEMIPSRYPGLFHDVDAIADDDVWVVGSKVVGRNAQAVAVHFDGETWTEAELPSTGGFGVLLGVSGAAPDDVWAVGQQRRDGVSTPLVLHFDGAAWSVAEIPDTGPREHDLRDVSAPTSTLAVAVGQRSDWEFEEDRRIMLEWNGSTWAEASRNEDDESNWLEAVDVSADGTGWAVGYHSTSPQTSYVARRTCS